MRRPFPPGFALPALGLLLACGGGGGGDSVQLTSTPSAPTGLASAGSLGHIALTWTASAGATGYHVYRSSGGASTRITASPVTATAYDDAIPSPAGDGVLYTYAVTAVTAAGESVPSAAVSNLHGTRVPASASAGFTATAALSPYVVDGTSTLDGGDVTIPAGAMLCIRPGAVLSLPDGATLNVLGTFRAVGTAAAPATVNGHGFPANDAAHGIKVVYSGAVAYNAATGTGCLLDHAQVSGLALGNATLRFINSAPAFQHCKFTSNDPSGRTYLEWMAGCGAKFTRCAFSGIVPTVAADLRGQATFGVTQSAFTGGYYGLYVGPLSANPGLVAGQISGNSLNGAKDAVIYFVTGSTDVPLGGNFWAGGSGSPPLPAINALGSTNTVTLSFAPALASAPSPVGPDW